MYEGETQIGLFHWPKIDYLDFRKKKLDVRLREDLGNGEEEFSFVFR